MNDWSDFEREVRSRVRKPGPRCAVGVMLDGLSPEGRVAVEKVLNTWHFTIPAVGGALAQYVGTGIPSPWSLANHRRGKCACQR